MKVSYQHGLSKEQAAVRLDQFVSQMLELYGNQVTEQSRVWQGDELLFSLQTLGFKVSGSALVTDTEVIVDAKLPLLARPFEGELRQRVEAALARAFGSSG